jgi:hypothetical protein
MPARTPLLAAAPALLALLALRAGTPGAAQTAPDFSGEWTLNRVLSDDAAAKVKEVAGPDVMTGAKTVGGQTFFPRASYGREVDRVNLRQFLLEAVTGLAELEIEQTAEEVKTIHGEDGVRIFSLKRESGGTGALGVKLVRRARFQGEQLTLESESGKTKLLEVLTLVPARKQLVHALRYEAEAFPKPLELRLVYDRAASP